MRLHVCLVDVDVESRINHNVFVEAAAEQVKLTPKLVEFLAFHRNRDALELANELAMKPKDFGHLDVDDQIRKVGMLNGANNKLLGNHWFSHGARNAIDENLHRRSSPMCIGSLLLNLATAPQTRSVDELVTNV